MRREMADPARVQQRLDAVMGIAESRLSGDVAGLSLPGAVMQWQFGVGLIPHLVLVAAGRNPTVRRRYAACRDVLADAGAGHHYTGLLSLAGYDRVGDADMAALFPSLEQAFDVIAPLVTDSMLAHPSDVQPHARAVAVGGVRSMIANGDVREAMFWLLATWCRLMLARNAIPGPVEHEEAIRADFLAAIGTVGVHDHGSVAARMKDAREALPFYRRLAGRIADARCG